MTFSYLCYGVHNLLTGHLYGVGLIVPDGGCQANTLNLVCIILFAICMLL